MRFSSATTAWMISYIIRVAVRPTGHEKVLAIGEHRANPRRCWSLIPMRKTRFLPRFRASRGLYRDLAIEPVSGSIRASLAAERKPVQLLAVGIAPARAIQATCRAEKRAVIAKKAIFEGMIAVSPVPRRQAREEAVIISFKEGCFP